MANKKKKSPVQKAISEQTLLPDISKASAEAEVKPMMETMQYIPTSNPDLFRYADENGNWQFYWLKSRNLYLPAVSRILKYGVAKGERFYEYLLNTDKATAKTRLESAGERGSRVHEAIKWLIDGKVVDRTTKFKNDLSERYEELASDEWRYLISWTKWAAEFKPEVIAHEISVYKIWAVSKDGAQVKTIEEYDLLSEQDKQGYRLEGCAGTIDFIGTIEYRGRRAMVLPDWKTSAAIYDEYALQVAIYWDMVKQLYPIEMTGIVRMKAGKAGSKTPYEVKWWDLAKTARNYQAFVSAKNLHDLITDAANYDPSEDQEQLPISLSVNVPKVQQEIKKIKKVKKIKEKNG